MNSIAIEAAKNGWIVRCGNKGETPYSVLEVYESVETLMKAIERKLLSEKKKIEKKKPE